MGREFAFIRKIHFSLVFLGVIIMSGCVAEEPVEKVITLPETPILTNSQSWAIVTDSYLRITRDKDINSEVLATLRRGEVLEIIRSQLSDRGTVIWYEVKNEDVSGWVQSTSIKMYNNRSQAETASRETRKEAP